MVGCKLLPAHIYLNRNLSHQGLIANGAHEFMHVLQFTYPVVAQCVTDYYTTLEATAVWATHHVYPKNDWEHKYADHYLTKQWVSFAYDDRNASKEFRYGAYLLPLFLDSRFGPSIVKQIWDRTLSTPEELAAIDGALLARSSTFEREWPRFIAANWNRDIPNTYLKSDDMDLRQADPKETFVMTMNSSGIASHPHNVGLPHASSAYYHVKFGDSASRSVMIVNGLRFKADSEDLTGAGNSLVFTGLDLFDRSGVSMQVYLKVNGVWQSGPVDLSNFMWSSICRDNPAGKIDEAIFIYGNAEIGTTMPNYPLLAARSRPPGLLVTNIGCRDWTGSLDMTDPLTGGQERLEISNIVLKNAISTAAPRPFPAGTPSGPYPLEPGDEISPLWGWPYTLTSGNATWTYDDQSSTCTDTGRWSASIASPLSHVQFSNYTPPGNAAHGLTLPGLLSGVLLILQKSPLSYTSRCVDSQGKETTKTVEVGPALDIGVFVDDPAVRISNATGLSVSGTEAQTDAAGSATGTWSLQGATR